jgi:hypothetical protein
MITITIQPQNADQVQILAWAMTKLLEPVADEPVVKEEAPAKKPKAAKPAPTPAPAIETPAEPEAPPTAPAITLEEVRAKLVAYKEKGNALKDLFETVGCANLSSVPAERYAELLDNMKTA